MTPEEARDHALQLLGLDPFQRIAVEAISRDLEGIKWPPQPGSEHERKLIELGRVVTIRPDQHSP
jgi:hypothetical protein